MKSGGENFEKNEEWHNSDERLLIKNNKDPPNEDLNQINCDFGRNTQNNEEEYVRRPMNAFMVWSRSERRKLALKYPNMLNCEISKLLGAEWSKMSENDKKPYVQESKKLRTIHSQKYPEYSYRPRRKKRKSDTSNTFCNTSAVNTNGLSCYTLQNNELFDSSYTNGNFNNYGFYYDQYPNSSYLSGMENSSTPCQNSNYMSSYNRNDKMLNYFPSYQPNTYSNTYTDSFKVMAPFSTNDNNYQCGNYFSSIPYMQSTVPPAENLDKNVTYNYGTINTLFPEIVNNNSIETNATETSKQNTTGIVQHQNVVASESCQPNIN